MKTYLIGYDLIKQGQNYDALTEEIKNMGNWWHCLGSTWIIKTNLDSVQIRDRLILKIDNNDKLLVVRLREEAAWVGFEKECSDWLKNNLTDKRCARSDLLKLNHSNSTIHKMGLFRSPWSRWEYIYNRSC